MKRCTLWLIAAVTTFASVVVAAARPNIIVVMTDDLSTDAMQTLLDGGWMPNLQSRIIDQGVRFENAFVTNSSCCPSRVTFLTGLYSHNHGVLANNSPHPFVPGIGWPGWWPSDGNPGRNQSTIATWLQAEGYFTAYVGKYLNGYGQVAPGGANPKTYVPPGWNDWQGLIDPLTYIVYGYQVNDNGTVVDHGTAETDYQTDVLSARSVQVIQERAQAGGPFFLFVNPLAPHVELSALIGEAVDVPDFRDLFSTRIRPAPRHAHLADDVPENGEMPLLVPKPSFNEQDVSDKPSCPHPPPLPGLVLSTEPDCAGDRLLLRPELDYTGIVRQYRSMLASMLAVDDMLGAIFDALDAAQLTDSTIVVFTSDNGWFYGEHRLSNKVLPYEESIRVPLFIRAPGYAMNATSEHTVLNNDMAPTLAELAGTVPPYAADGVSLVPLLQDPKLIDWHRRFFLIEHWFVPSFSKFEMATFSAVRGIFGSWDYLYVTWRAEPQNPGIITHREFYDLNTDPYQMNSIALPMLPRQILDQLVQLFRTCREGSCADVEGL